MGMKHGLLRKRKAGACSAREYLRGGGANLLKGDKNLNYEKAKKHCKNKETREKEESR